MCVHIDLSLIDRDIKKQNEFSFFIGIDPSYKNTGIAYIDTLGRYGFESVSLRKIDGKKSKSGMNLVEVFSNSNDIFSFVNDITNRITKNISLSGADNDKVSVGVEISLFYGSRMYQVAMLVGCLYYALVEKNLKVELINVNSVRKLLNIRGNLSSERKKSVIFSFWKSLGAECDNTDQSDALSVAYYLYHNNFGGAICFKERVYGK